MPSPTDAVGSLSSGQIDRLLRAAASHDTVGDEPAGRYMARLMAELADRDEDVLLHTYLAERPADPPTFGVRVAHAAGEGAVDEVLGGLAASRALRAARARTGIDDTTVEVVAHEAGIGEQVVLRADAGEELTFVLPGETGVSKQAKRPGRLRDWATSFDFGGEPDSLPAFDQILDSPGEVRHPLPRIDDQSGTEIDISTDDLRRAITEAVRAAAGELSVQFDVAELRDAIAASAEAVLAGQPKAPSAEEVAAAVSARLESVPSVEEVADAVLSRLDPMPSADEIADRVIGRAERPPSPEAIARVVEQYLPEAASPEELASHVVDRLASQPARRMERGDLDVLADALVDRLDAVTVEIDSEAVVASVGPLMPTVAQIVAELQPELARLQRQTEQALMDQTVGLPQTSDIDLLRTDLQSVREELRASKATLAVLTDELTGSSRRSREQIDTLSERLAEDLGRWSRRVEDRLDRVIDGDSVRGRPANRPSRGGEDVTPGP